MKTDGQITNPTQKIHIFWKFIAKNHSEKEFLRRIKSLSRCLILIIRLEYQALIYFNGICFGEDYFKQIYYLSIEQNVIQLIILR